MRKVVLLLASLLTWIGCALGQQRTVTGVVTSAEDGEPMVQLAVQVKGTQTGVVTDADGRYTVRVAGPETVLVFTYTGYETQEITVGEQTTINVVMQTASEEIDEVMVVAFGKTKKSTFTGSATAVGSAELERKQVSNVLNALSGKVPGVSVTSGDNQPGKSASIRIRGEGSFSASSSPLYVVDGVPFGGDIASINPADVESTVLLKDAASAALYGARAANGVVMITTKSGANAREEGQMNVNVAAKIGYNFRGIPDYEKVTDPKAYASKYFEAIYNFYSERLPNASEDVLYKRTLGRLLHPFRGIIYFPFTKKDDTAPWFESNGDGTWRMNSGATVGAFHDGNDGNKYWMQPDDWNKEAYQPNMRQEYTVSLSGRSSKTNYFFSSGYLNDKGYTVRSSFERFTTRLRGDYRPKKWLNLGANLSYSGYKTNQLDADITASGRSSANIFAMTNFAAPIYPLYVRDANKNILKTPTGRTIYDFGTGEFPGLYRRPFMGSAHPLAMNTYDLNDKVAHIISVRSNADLILPYGFRFSLNGGFDADNTYATESQNPFYGQYADVGGEISKTFERQTTFNIQQLLTWNHAYGDNHIDVLIGHEYYERDDYEMSGSKTGQYRPKNRELSGAINSPSTSSLHDAYRVEGFLGRLQYDWAERYFLTASFRRDGSSNFAEKHRWGNFGSVGVSWLLSNEPFMESTRSFLDLLKVKASYGIQGNDNLPVGYTFPYLDLFRLTNNYNRYASSFYRKGNPDLTWETSHNINVGVEFAFFKHRLTGSIDLYQRKVTDMLFQVTVPLSSGYSSYWDNIGAMSNRGIDFELRGIPYRDRNIVWSIYVNGGVVKNRLDKLPDEWKRDEYGYISGYNVYKEGGTLYDLFMPKYKGVDDKGHSLWQTEGGGVTNDHAQMSDNKNLVEFKDLSPVMRGGFGTNLDFFGFDFNASFSYGLGGRGIDGTYQQLMHAGSDNGRAWHKDILKSWTESKKSDIPKVDFSDEYANMTSDRFLVSRTYLSIDNLTLGYTFKKEWMDRIGIGSLRIYAVADNVWLFSARKGYDPRFGGGVGYKVIRSISGGLNLTF